MRTFAVRGVTTAVPRVEFFLEESREDGDEVVHLRARTESGNEYYVVTIGPNGLERAGDIDPDAVPFALNEEGEIQIV